MVGDESDDERINLKPRTRPYYFRRCKRVRLAHIKSLPNELLSDILVRLPADHLYDIARLVCRKWCHIIHSYDFINTQIQHSTYGLLLSRNRRWGSNHPILITATQDGRIETSEFSYLCRSKFMMSCNGLCIEPYQFTALPYIINPATKQSFVLPSFPSDQRMMVPKCRMAFAPRSMKYKLILPYLKSGAFCLSILTFGVDKTWRDVVFDPVWADSLDIFLSYCPFVTEGSLHWACGGIQAVTTFDMETEMLTMSNIHFSDAYMIGKRMRFLSTGRFLSLLVGHGDLSWDVWGMKTETGEWRKVLPCIKLGDQKCRIQQLASAREDQVLEPFGWVKYPQVLALHFSGVSRTWIFYNLDTHEINSTELPHYCEEYNAIVHKNSLTWLS